MATKTYFRIEDDGKIYRVSQAESLVNTSEDIMMRYATDAGVKIQKFMDAQAVGDGAFGHVGVSTRQKLSVFTIPVALLPMRACFAINAEGILSPNFSAPNAEQRMNLKWRVPDGMRAFLIMNIQHGGDLYCENQWLVAMDKAGRTYRLPTSNCYEDARLCTGSYDNSGTSCMDVIMKGWRQFQISAWQSDLNDRGGVNGMANSMKMFRYKPNEKEGFTQLEPEQEWTTLCTKIANEYLTNNLVIAKG